jgi:hypothetical protein
MNDFFAEIQELFGLIYIQGLSNDLYDNEIYFSLCISLFGITFIWIALFYFGLRSPRWGTLGKWWLWILIGSIINSIISFLIAQNSIAEIYLSQNLEIPYSFSQFLSISFSNFISGLFLSFFYSVLLKRRSINSSTIPF